MPVVKELCGVDRIQKFLQWTMGSKGSNFCWLARSILVFPCAANFDKLEGMKVPPINCYSQAWFIICLLYIIYYYNMKVKREIKSIWILSSSWQLACPVMYYNYSLTGERIWSQHFFLSGSNSWFGNEPIKIDMEKIGLFYKVHSDIFFLYFKWIFLNNFFVLSNVEYIRILCNSTIWLVTIIYIQTW